VPAAETAQNRLARGLFAPLGPSYDRAGAVLSLGQDPRWRRFLVSRVPAAPRETVLDVATGTAAVAVELVRARGCAVVGVDQSPEMLATARERLRLTALTDRIRLVEARAEALPFDDAAFDHVTFTYLLRYVEDVPSTMRELTRVVRSGGTVAMLEFGVPPSVVPRAVWELYVRAGLPVAGLAFGGEWWRVGRFLRGSITDLYRRYPLPGLLRVWDESGIEHAQARRLSLGGGVVISGTRR
jgi:demethylmenaquinone methyltransferase / 2-methoxy-6-polyprenyl-1,4-benzoquinol methylase